MVIERGIQYEQLWIETANKGTLWLTDVSRGVRELLFNIGFFACQRQRIETFDEIKPLRGCRERSAHDGWNEPAEEGPQAGELAPDRESARGSDNIGNLTRGGTASP